ncbi:MAG: chlorophyll synthase ChlG [Cyanobacteria bacterium P01_D01_bin.123]
MTESAVPDPKLTKTELTDEPGLETSTSESAGAKARQMLGMKGGDVSDRSVWQIHLQLMKPVTWVPLIWGVLCGAASSGNYTWTWENVFLAGSCMLMSGPLLAGYTQTLNDFYDREIDAINEPYRPIPSGAISIPRVVAQIVVLMVLGLGISFGLDVWTGHEFPIMTVLAAFGIFLAYIYSAPPLKLKQNGWLGNYALGASYIALPWWAGHALFGQLNGTVMFLTLLYSIAGLGIAVVNDFKSVEGDAALGLKSLPVMFGVQTAALISVMTIDFFQIGMAAFLVGAGQHLLGTILIFLVIPQIVFQDMYFLRSPLENDVKYQASAQPFLVLGMLVMAFGIARAGI